MKDLSRKLKNPNMLDKEEILEMMKDYPDIIELIEDVKVPLFQTSMTRGVTKRYLFKIISKYVCVTQIDFFEKFKDDLNWKLIQSGRELPEDFMRLFKDRLDWFDLPYDQKNLSEEFMREFADRLDIEDLGCTQNLSEGFIREFINKGLEWSDITTSQTLSENFIREFKDTITREYEWDNISVHQKLSEDFIREFKDVLYWEYIERHQDLSFDFIMEHESYIENWSSMIVYQNLDTVSIEKIADRVDFEKAAKVWLMDATNHIFKDDFVKECASKIKVDKWNLETYNGFKISLKELLIDNANDSIPC